MSTSSVTEGGSGLVPLWLDPDRSEQLPPVRVPARLVRALDARARLYGRSRAAEIRLALGAWLESGGGAPASPAERLMDE